MLEIVRPGRGFSELKGKAKRPLRPKDPETGDFHLLLR